MRPPRRTAPLRRVVLALGLALAAPAAAQDLRDMFDAQPGDAPVALVADEVLYDEAAGTVTARGNVVVYYGPRTLSAAEIVYDSRAERIRATGPLTLRDPGGSVLVADAADLDPQLRDGVIAGARAMIADGAGTLSAVEAQRVDGRYTALSKAVYSSCQVCLAAPTPLWSIRARRVLHDEVAQDVHYEDAVFEIMGTPVGWLPYFSHPAPGVTRRSGFLAPTFGNSSVYGVSAKIPYFFALDPTRDLTLTAFPTEDDGGILQGEYRQRFDFGRIDIAGSAGLLDIREGEGDELRGHTFSSGRFNLAALGLSPGTEAGFDVNLASDDGYLRRYDFTDEDRLTSQIFVERYHARDYFSLAGVYFQSLRDGERAGDIPRVLPEFSMRQVFDGALAGGDVGLEGGTLLLTRTRGRDVGRLSVGADWSREEIVAGGVALRAFGALRGDIYHVADDPDFEEDVATRFAPHAGVEARLPLIAYGESAAHLLEPGVQFVVAPENLNDDDIPNEDSTLVEFDETAIFDVDRFPGMDRVESGTRINLGLRYSRVAEDPLRLDAAVGQVFRLTDETPFSPGSGLDERTSDYVAAWSVGYDPYFLLSNRLRVGDGFDIARNEVVGRATLGPASVSGGYLFLAEDETAGAEDDRSEVSVGGALRLDPRWTVAGFVRRDIGEDRYIEASTGLTYASECAQIELYVERDFTDSEDAPASTDVGLRVRIFGAADGAGARSGVCGQP